MLRLFSERPTVRVVADQWGSPTFTGDLAGAMLSVVKKSDEKGQPFGIYHFTNEGKTNWFAFAEAIYQLAKSHGIIKKEVELQPITTADYPTKAVRPKNSHLSKEKIKSGFSLQVRDWLVALEDYFKEYVESINAEKKIN
jgi:dTDP-4-dehydrorhamnose reductase